MRAICALHDLANSGAQMWDEALEWPDYLWSCFTERIAGDPPTSNRRIVPLVPSPDGSGADAELAPFHLARLEPSPIRLSFGVSGELDFFVELKSIRGDHAEKLASFRPELPWPSYLDHTLTNILSKHLKRADRQIQVGKRVLGLVDRPGATILVNESSSGLTVPMVSSFLTQAIRGLPNTDLIVYLTDSRPRDAYFIFKDPTDVRARQFSHEFLLMLRCVAWEPDPTVRGGPYPRLVVRVEMDQRSREMIRTWSTGWRDARDTSPIPCPSLKLTVIRADEP
jgi:hypothetical protein